MTPTDRGNFKEVLQESLANRKVLLAVLNVSSVAVGASPANIEIEQVN